MATENKTIKPSWLPDIISVEGRWDDILKILYNIFEQDFIAGKPKLNKFPVFWDRKIENGYEIGFWHLIEKDNKVTGERNFDPRRAERLPWCAPTICCCNENLIKMWEFQEAKNKVNIYVWLEKFNYVIIFNKKRLKLYTVAFLITAFYVDGKSKRKDLSDKYSKRII